MFCDYLLRSGIVLLGDSCNSHCCYHWGASVIIIAGEPDIAGVHVRRDLAGVFIIR